MNLNEADKLTSHAMLVIWGQFAHCLGLIERVMSIPMRQKTVTHRPQTKVLEFLVAILGGLEHMKDISRSAHPLDQDQEVAKAWGQASWADYSGVSRTLTTLSETEAQQVLVVLEELSQPFLDEELFLALHREGEILYDGDLTGRAVSNTSTTYPQVAYGHMDGEIRLGYQAALVSFHSPTYGRLWLSVTPHPGDVVSWSQAEALVLEAERRTGLRPLRRTDLLCQRLGDLEKRHDRMAAQVGRAEQNLTRAQQQLQATQQALQHWQQRVREAEAFYQVRGRPERPHSRLAQARRRLGVHQRRLPRREQAVAKAHKSLQRQQERLGQCQVERERLATRLVRFEQENATNPVPICATFRLDAGFGTRENLALLIEMGYQVYSKPQGAWLTRRIQRRVDPQTSWTRVGKNAAMVAWHDLRLADFPYPLDVALERFHTGQGRRHGVLLHFGADPVTTDLSAWFQRYNGRQTIEAGIKEGNQVFQMHHLKVRSESGLFLQEHFTVFAANFIRWAAKWLQEQCPQIPDGWHDTRHLPVKQQVKVAAHTSAWVTWDEQSCLLRFTDHSIFAGRSLLVRKVWWFQPVLPFLKSCYFSSI